MSAEHRLCLNEFQLYRSVLLERSTQRIYFVACALAEINDAVLLCLQGGRLSRASTQATTNEPTAA
jgi:hypothetical protein